MTARRELTLAVLSAATAGALGLFAGARPWFDLVVDREPPLPAAEATVDGATVSPLVPALALVVLAAAAGLLATRGGGRRVVGAVVLLAGVGLLVVVLRWLGELADTRLLDLAVVADLPRGLPVYQRRDGVWLAAAAGLSAVVVGAFTGWRAGRWPVLGRRYEAPTAPATDEPAATDRDVWDALDRGEDPTARG